jgi:hypothetical protein
MTIPFNYRKGSINWFNSNTSLSQGRTWIFPHHIVILFFVFNDLRCDSVVHVIDICGIGFHSKRPNTILNRYAQTKKILHKFDSSQNRTHSKNE